jgi:hypothetical protein
MASKTPDRPGYPSEPRAPVMPPAEPKRAVPAPQPVSVPPYVHPARRKPGQA